MSVGNIIFYLLFTHSSIREFVAKVKSKLKGYLLVMEVGLVG